MRRLLLLLVAVLVTGLGGPAHAGAVHDTYVESYDDSFHVTAEENPCGAWAARFHEVRTGGAQLIAAPGGQVEGEYHVRGAVDGRLRIVPEDPALPTYTGSYRETFVGVVAGVDPDGQDVTRVSTYRLRAPLVGSDGSRIVLALSGQVTVDGTGALRVSRDAMVCE